MNGNDLIVLRSKIVSLSLQMSDLHEQAAGQAAADVRVVIRTIKVRAE